MLQRLFEGPLRLYNSKNSRIPIRTARYGSFLISMFQIRILFERHIVSLLKAQYALQLWFGSENAIQGAQHLLQT